MKKQLLISVVVCMILTSCMGQGNISTASPSLTPESISIATTTPAIIIPTQPPPPTATITPLPAYNTKQKIFSYTVSGYHSYFDFFFEDFHRPYDKLVLYEDGLLVIPGSPYKHKFLSSDEINSFLSNLESLGFFSLESNGKHDPTDNLYNYGSNYQKSADGVSYCLSVETDKPKSLCIYEPDLQYLIPEMKNLLSFLDNYKPEGMTPYSPDRMLVLVQKGRDPNSINLPENVIPWSENLPSLETSNPIIFVDGNMVKEIYALFEDGILGQVFTQNGKEYTVYISIVLPHEKVTNAYYP